MSELCLHRIEDHWKAKTTASNKLFEERQFKEALTGYEASLYRAEVLNNYSAACMEAGIPFVQIYIISCNNIANTYVELNQPGEAEKMLKRVIYYLLHLAGEEHLNKQEIQRALKNASIYFADFMKKHGCPEKQQDVLFSALKEQSANIY